MQSPADDDLSEDQLPSDDQSEEPTKEPAKDSRDEAIAALQREISELKAVLSSPPPNQTYNIAYQQQAVPPPVQPVQPPKFEYYKKEDIQKAFDEGDTSHAFDMLEHNQRTATEQALWEFRQKELAPLKDIGTRTISDLSDRVLRQEMVHLEIPEIKKEYDSLINVYTSQGFPVDPAARKEIYNWVVGRNMDKIIAREREAAIRQKTETPVQSEPSRTSRSGGTDKEYVPRPEEYYSQEALDLMRRAGRTPDMEAQRKGYADFQDWYRKVVLSRPGKTRADSGASVVSMKKK
jgi:hypothetical protein